MPADDHPVAVETRGGIASLERALEDEETAGVAAWVDTAADGAWVSPDHADVVRAMDRFHVIPDVPEWADGWAEWLYFNGQAEQTRFYLTFLVGPMQGEGRRAAGVRLQLDDGRGIRSYSESTEVDAAEVLAEAPDLTIGRNQVRLVDGRYLISLDLPPADVVPDTQTTAGASKPSGVRGEIALEAGRGRSLPPLIIRGARGWTSGYTVPVMSGRCRVESPSVGRRSHSTAGPVTTTTTGGTGPVCPGNGGRSMERTCRSFTAGSTHRPTQRTRGAFPGSSWSSARSVRSATPPG